MATYDEQVRIVASALRRFGDSPKAVLNTVATTMGASPEETFEVLLDMADAAITEAEKAAVNGETTNGSDVLAKRVEEMLGQGAKPEEHIGAAEREAVAKYLGPQNIGDIKNLLAQKQSEAKRKLQLLKADPRLNGPDIEKERVLQAIGQLERQIITSDPEKAMADLAKADSSPNKEFLPFLIQELIKGNINYPTDLSRVAKATANFHKISELGLLTPEQQNINNYENFDRFYEEAMQHSDPTEDLGVGEIPPMEDIWEVLRFIHDNFAISEEELKEIKVKSGAHFNEKEFYREQFKKALIVFLEYLGRNGFHTRGEGEVHGGAQRHRDVDAAGLGTAGVEKDITGEVEFNPETTQRLYADIFHFLSFAPGLKGGPPRDAEAAMTTAPAAKGEHLSAPDEKNIPTRKFILSRLQSIYFDKAKEPAEKWESMRSWLVSGMGLSAFGLQTIKLGDWSLGVDKMPAKAREAFKGQSAYGKRLAGYYKDKNKGKIKDDKGKGKTGPTMGDLDEGEDMSAKGLRLFLTEHDAIASIMAVHPTADQYKQIVEAHSKGVWLGLNEGYNNVPKKLDPREDYKPESGYEDSNKTKPAPTMESEITAADIPFAENKVEMDDMMEAIASQESPDGKGIQDKGVGEAISGTDNESDKLKGVHSKNTDGKTMADGSECNDTGNTSDAGIEEPDGKGLQKKSVGKAQY